MSNPSSLLVLEERASYLDQDRLWKEVITDLFEPFMLFFAPELYEKLDWSKEPDSLEQEFHGAFPEKKGKRVTDKLMKVYLKDGEEQWVLVHIEVQGSKDDDFSERMFQYFYRIFDAYHQKIFAIALLTDVQPSFKPTAFKYDFHGTNLIYEYNTYKLSEQDEAELLQSNNPFALVVLAGIYTIKSRNNVSLRYQFKRQLFKLLLQEESPKNTHEDTSALFYFIDFLLEIPEGMTRKLQDDMMPLIEKEANHMAQTMNSEPSPTLKEIFAIKREEGKLEGRLEVARMMLKEGYSVEKIIKVTNLGEKELDEIKRN